MKIEKTLEGKRLAVRLEGELNTVTAPELEAAIASDLASIDDIVFDMSELTYITSAGLRILLVCQQEVEDRGEVVVCGANPEIREIMEVTGFDSIMTLQ